MPNGVNGINTISPSIRDFLLSRNLILSDTITNNGLSGLATGLGYPASISTYPESVQPSTDIMTDGDLYRDLNLINNPYGTDNNEVYSVSTDNIQNIGNLPIGTPQTQYPDLVGSKLLDSEFSISANEGREQMLYNRYQPNEDEQQLVDLSNNGFNYSESNGGYVDRHGHLNVGGPSTNPLDVIGSVLNGGGIGIGGEVNFDVRSSLAGRALSATGIINDTPLGIIGGKQLLIALGNKVAFNAQRETLGQLNLNPFSLAGGSDIIIPNYSITVGSDSTTRAIDTGLNILGIENPFRNESLGLFDAASSIFYKENPVDTKTRIEHQLLNTGKGQRNSLFANLFENKYRLGVTDGSSNEDGVAPNFYIFHDGNGGMINMLDNLALKDEEGNFLGVLANGPNSPISPSNHSMGKFTKEAGFKSLKDINFGEGEGYTWAHTEAETLPIINENGDTAESTITPYYKSINFDSKTLLGKTKRLFQDNKMTVMVSRRGLFLDDTNELDNEVWVGQNKFISRGSGVKSGKALEGSTSDPNEVFCRSWTSVYKYNQVQNLQKSEGLGSNFGLRNRNTASSSVLDDNGFVKITPYIADCDITQTQPHNVKKFMFSLENLAWHGASYNNLPANEKGPGDPKTGTKGRIMWFPPYDLKFSENSSLNWDTHEFIGRGEPVYTYNNTERGGSLSFKVLMDHPSYLNDMRGYYDNDLFNSIAAGCAEFDLGTFKNLTKNEADAIEVANAENPIKVVDKPEKAPEPFYVYFPNDVANLDSWVNYEANGSQTNPLSGYGTIPSEGYTAKKGRPYKDRTDYGLNKPFRDPNFIPTLKQKLYEECPSCKIRVIGHASLDGKTSSNVNLANDRFKYIEKYLKDGIFDGKDSNDPAFKTRFEKGVGKGDTQAGCKTGIGNDDTVDTYCKKFDRKVRVEFVPDPKIKQQLVDAEIKRVENKRKVDLNEKIKSRFFNEAMYFEKLKQEDRITYDRIGEKIKFFHPSFHSVTPEGFNSRLTFLNQCTRQGPSINAENPNSPSNLAFGMAPVCILRIGDFYHTKIIIDSIDINYDSGNGVQWDLNPEGVGVQPMIADVSINFKFIGGSSLDGPINKLQNAVSFNFFANTEIYDPRADYIKFDSNPNNNAIYMNDNIKFSDIEDSAKQDGIEANGTVSKDQGQQAEIENSKPVSGSSINTITSGATPQILGFNWVETNGWVDSLFAHTIMIKLKSQGIMDGNSYLLSDEEGDKFLAKGLKFTLQKPGGAIIHEELVKYGFNAPQGLKSLMNAVDFFYELGQFTSHGTRVENVTKGNYELTVSYNGRRIQTVLIALDSDTKFKATY